MNNADCLTKCYNYLGIQNDIEKVAEILYKVVTYEMHKSEAKEWLKLNYPDLFEKLKTPPELPKYKVEESVQYKPGFDHGLQKE
jgi:hypothetical protein